MMAEKRGLRRVNCTMRDGHRAEQEAAQEDALGQARAEFQVGGEIAAQQLPVLRHVFRQPVDLGEQRAGRQVGRSGWRSTGLRR